MNNLALGLVRLTKHNRDGAFATQANRRRGLVAMATDLYALGYKLPKPNSIKPKHVTALLAHWQSQGLSNSTIKNRLGWIRWWTQKVDKASILPRTNAELGVPGRARQRQSKARDLPSIKLPDERMQLALELMAQFGLRFEEALKLRPQQADQQTVLQLQGSWTKGGRARAIAIRTVAQRQLLNRARELVGTSSLVPPDRSYVSFRKAMEGALRRRGIKRPHGLRHAYAQQRYLELTGRACPLAGGPQTASLSPSQEQQDRAARRLISEELGHSRVSITGVYLG